MTHEVKQPKIRVRAVRAHTYEGEYHELDDVYEVDEAALENLRAVAMAYRLPEAGGPKPMKGSRP